MSNIPPNGCIPPNVRARKQGQERPGISIGRQGEQFTAHKTPVKVQKSENKTLKLLEEWGEEEERKCMDMLKFLPPDLPEYDEVNTRLDELRDKLYQIRSQTWRI